MTRFRSKIILLLATLLVVIASFATGCGGSEFDKQVLSITSPYRFHLFNWEVGELFSETGKLFLRRPAVSVDDTAEVLQYFNNIQQITSLETQQALIKYANQQPNTLAENKAIEELKAKNDKIKETVVRTLETQIRDVLTEEGIRNPFNNKIKIQFNFPPMNFHLGAPPYLLVVSPRDHIESIKEVTLLPELNLDDMKKIEDEVDDLGVSSLVVGLGGIATYPSFVSNRSDLRYAINTAAEEWLHQYLAFTPLGFRYVLDQAGIRSDYDIATINETVAGIAAEEIGEKVYNKYYGGDEIETPGDSNNQTGFDFNKEMRQIRIAVDDYLSKGEIDQAETFMKNKQEFLLENGYFIRKLNQAYFAFYGTYAGSPTSVSPIGTYVKDILSRSASLKDFLDEAASITSLNDLTAKLK
jgi:hypothetical protein